MHIGVLSDLNDVGTLSAARNILAHTHTHTNTHVSTHGELCVYTCTQMHYTDLSGDTQVSGVIWYLDTCIMT